MEAEFEVIVQSVEMTVESSMCEDCSTIYAAEFEVIVQSVAMTVESSHAKTAPPHGSRV